MGILELLTIVFIVLKLIGVIDWSWLLVLLPTIISVTFYILWFIGSVIFFTKAAKKQKRMFKNDSFFK